MEENINKEESRIRVRDRFKMDPSENAWNQLDAELERKQASIYKQRGNRFKSLSIGLALLLVSFVTYYYLSTQHAATGIADNSGNKNVVNADNGNPNKLPSGADSKLGVSPPHSVPVASGGLGTRNDEKPIIVLRSSSLYANRTAGYGAASSEVTTESTSQNNGNRQMDKSGETNNNGNSSAVTDNDSKAPAIAANGGSDNASKAQESVSDNSTDKKSTDVNPSLAAPANNSQNQSAAENKSATSAANPDTGKSKNSPPPPDNKISSRWSIDGFYSPNYYAKNQLVSNGNSYGNDVSEYNNREKPEYSYAAGLRLRYDLSNQWSVAAGGTYSTIAYSMSLPAIYAWYGSDNQVHYQYPTSCGTIEMPNPTGAPIHNKDSLNTTVNCEQVVRIISVPVTVRFRIPKNNFTLYADAGLCVNFVIQEKANMSIGNTQYTVINNIDGLKTMNYGYLFGVGVAYGISNGIDLFAEPAFRGSITSLTKDVPFNCYPMSLGVNLGVSWHF